MIEDYDYGSLTLSNVTNESFINYKFKKKIIDLHIVSGNKLDELIIPEGIKTLFCQEISLKKIHLPDSLEELYCKGNLLEEIELPTNFKYIDLKRNKIRNVKLRGQLNKTDFFLNLRHNNLDNLDFMNQIKISNFNFKYDYDEEKTISGIRDLQKIYVWNNPRLKREDYTRDHQKLLRFNRFSYINDDDYQPNRIGVEYFENDEPPDDISLEW